MIQETKPATRYEMDALVSELGTVSRKWPEELVSNELGMAQRIAADYSLEQLADMVCDGNTMQAELMAEVLNLGNQIHPLESRRLATIRTLKILTSAIGMKRERERAP